MSKRWSHGYRDGPLNLGVMHAVTVDVGGHLRLYRLATQVTAGNGSLKTSGLGSNSGAREAFKVGLDCFKANVSRVSSSIEAGDHDYHGTSSSSTIRVRRAP